MRRLPARHVFVFSLMAALACLVLTVWLGMNRTPWALLPAALTLWFVVDSWRAWNWSRPTGDLPVTNLPVTNLPVAEQLTAAQTRPADR
ncbi:hypothetical protein [Deinococcus sp.]|uniref:hypothetical protein n=1 Tax=Deinococcus sp. TaxID=47478 RepID=UPI00286DB207|nr:hypothetical protein [Deinococcus sp.]